MSLGLGLQRDLQSNHTIFYQANPHFGAKSSSVLAVLAKNTCVYVSRLLLRHSKSIVVHLKDLKAIDWNNRCISSLILPFFYKVGSHSGEKSSTCVAGLAINTCVYGCTLVSYHTKLNISLLSRFTKPWVGIVDGILVESSHFLPSQYPFLSNSTQFCDVKKNT